MYRKDFDANLEKDYKKSDYIEARIDTDEVLKRKDINLKIMLYKTFGVILIVVGGIWTISYNIIGYNYLASVLWSSFQWVTRGLYIGSGILGIIGVIYGFHDEKLGYKISILAGFIPITYALFIIVFIIFTMGFVDLYYYLLFFLSFIMSGILMGYLSQAIMILIGAILINKAQEYK
jgi:hypothetical protein